MELIRTLLALADVFGARILQAISIYREWEVSSRSDAMHEAVGLGLLDH